MPTPRSAVQTMVLVGLALASLPACEAGRDTRGIPGGAAAAAVPACEPVQTHSPNAEGQTPAFPGQTRACHATSEVAFDVQVVTDDLEHPWAVEPLPGGDLLVTERPGRMRIIGADGTVHAPLAGLPDVARRGQGGLLDVALGPGFADDGVIYWTFSERRDDGNATSVARGVLARDRDRIDDVRVLFRARPAYDGDKHFGSRIAIGPDGNLFITLGERSDLRMRPQAQQLDSHMGKILRIHPDGSAPDDNPFGGQTGALPEIWTLGHRNIQAAAFDGDGDLWEVEHGPQGGDELNRVRPGINYGWPLVSYGEEYSGRPIATAETSRPGFEQPVYYWDPVIAPSGAEFYEGDAFAGWRGNLFVGSLDQELLVRLVLEDGKVVGEEHLLADRGQRVRDVREGPDGFLYIVTDESDGELWRLVPAKR
ncbi:MAG: PQQ-dependent sugar dehydrogenase [Vicinamibacterales bacterium]